MVPTNSLAASPDIGSRAISRLTRRIVPFLFVLYIVAYLDRINVGFAALQMQQQLGFNDAVYGRAAGIFFLGYFLLQIPSNLILQRVGARRWVAVLMVTWGVVSCSTMFVTTARGFYTLRFCLGLAEAGFFPGIILFLRDWFPIGARARTMAWFMTAGPVAGIIGGPISGALLGLHGLHSLAGWQWLFLIEGFPAIVLGGVVFVYLSDDPQTAGWLEDGERRWLVDTLKSEQATASDHFNKRLLPAFANARVWLLALVFFGVNACGYGVTLWLPKLIHSRSAASSFGVGLLSAIPYVLAAIVMVATGIHSDRTGERRWHSASFTLLASVALFTAAYARSPSVMIAALSVAVLSGYSMNGPFWAISTSLLPGAAAAAGIALINAMGNLGGFYGAYVLGSTRSPSGEIGTGLLRLSLTMGVSFCLFLLATVGFTTRREECRAPLT
jgi:ACS family tartrate transporter-like MFS transporter